MFAATGLAGKQDCSLGVIHWCATDSGGLAAGALTCMVSVMHACGFDPCWRH